MKLGSIVKRAQQLTLQKAHAAEVEKNKPQISKMAQWVIDNPELAKGLRGKSVQVIKSAMQKEAYNKAAQYTLDDALKIVASAAEQLHKEAQENEAKKEAEAQSLAEIMARAARLAKE